MENTTKELDELLQIYLPDEYYEDIRKNLIPALTRWKASGIVAAPKEEQSKTFSRDDVKALMEVVRIPMQENIDTLKAIIQTGEEENMNLRQQIAEHKAINSLLAGDEPEVALANEVFQLRQQLKEREEALKELIPIAERELNIVTNAYEYDQKLAIIERARNLISK